YERKYLFRRFAHASNGSFNPCVITNKAAHIVNENILEADDIYTFNQREFFRIVNDSCVQRGSIGSCETVREPVWCWLREYCESFAAMSIGAVCSVIFLKLVHLEL
ncbi:hypothetical protein pdam_00001715, partial [Pocillopora damicornis]